MQISFSHKRHTQLVIMFTVPAINVIFLPQIIALIMKDIAYKLREKKNF